MSEEKQKKIEPQAQTTFRDVKAQNITLAGNVTAATANITTATFGTTIGTYTNLVVTTVTAGTMAGGVVFSGTPVVNKLGGTVAVLNATLGTITTVNAGTITGSPVVSTLSGTIAVLNATLGTITTAVVSTLTPTTVTGAPTFSGTPVIANLSGNVTVGGSLFAITNIFTPSGSADAVGASAVGLFCTDGTFLYYKAAASNGWRRNSGTFSAF